MQDPKTVVKASQWVRVCKGVYKGDLGFVTDVEAWGARVLVVPRLKAPTPQAAASLKRKRTAIRPDPRLFDPTSFSSMFQRQPKLHDNGIYTSRGLAFDHGLLRLNLDLHSISINSTAVPSQVLGLFKQVATHLPPSHRYLGGRCRSGNRSSVMGELPKYLSIYYLFANNNIYIFR
jgi:hypothetical protein